jgi:abnormal spindle-like microcephaly-associated protein
LEGDLNYEPTGQVEFTTEVRAPTLTGVRPRRAHRTGTAFQILEDAEAKPAAPVENRRRPSAVTRLPSDRKSSLLAQPAQRFRPKVNNAQSPPSRPVKQETETRPKLRLGTKTAEASPKSQVSERRLSYTGNEDELKKRLRRNTVYIPPDDTTVASVFMGLFSPLKKPHGEVMPQIAEDTQVNTLEARIAQRQARKSYAVSARKAPLQPSVKIAQEAAIRVDIPGKNGGKENMPPGTVISVPRKSAVKPLQPSKPKRVSMVSTAKSVCRNTTNLAPKQKATEPFLKSLAPPKRDLTKRDVLGEKQHNANFQAPRVIQEEQSGLRESKAPFKASASLNTRAFALSNRLGHSTTRSSRSGNMSKLKEMNQEYPMLTDNISKPALYEENWLSHQETVITQLVNALFECTNGDSTTYDPSALRLELLDLYHTDYFTQLYARLQASLSCGSLSIPKDVVSRNSRLRHDLGLRRKYLNIWVQSFDLRVLTAALETVVGRKITSDESLFESCIEASQETTAKRQKTIVRKLEGFLETFLLRNDDIHLSVSGTKGVTEEVQAKFYRRTVLRSIVLVVLLDQGRQSPGTGLPRRLFVASSPLKSSVEVLQALSRVLLPSCGDIVKPLSHLGCHLSYKQHQLQEYDYQMNNIAVDLRDGVRLTRMVEVLFFTSEHERSDVEDQTEVTLATGEALSLLGDERDFPLSKHLKYPCISRAAKVFNVNIALSALSSVRGSGTFVQDLRAEDIVDGYREKTIALLWALVSKWGLAGLVDWDDVRSEVIRLKQKAQFQPGCENAQDYNCGTDDSLGGDEHAHLLQQWVATLASLKGLSISNMTTSFADGRIFESVVDEYEPYIVGNQESLETSIQPGLSLESRLRLLGCSSQFGKYSVT